MSRNFPLVVDLDGTLAKVDGLVDAVVTIALRRPKYVSGALGALFTERYAFKEHLAQVGAYSPETTPLREDLVAYLTEQRAAGREIHLVTASPQAVADKIAARLGIFTTVMGSRDGINLKGEAKARSLCQRFSEGFSYAGNDHSDLAVWRHARSIVTVAALAGVQRAAEQLGVPIERVFPAERQSLRNWLRLMRVHQWSKNVLMFVPLLLAHRYDDLEAIFRVVIGFLVMGLVASATYIVNDLSDLEADRLHATKRRRPLAAAEISSSAGALFAAVIGLVGLIGAFMLDGRFAFVLVMYVVLTLSYSVRLKVIALLDAFVLGLLYMTRIVMGVVLIGVAASPWLLTFSLFFFFSLSMAKRHVEIIRAAERAHVGRIKGRGYEASDAPLTLALGISASLAAVLLLFLYVVNDAYPVDFYKHPQWLWAIGPLVFLWTSRIWLKSHRGKLDDDPVTFAISDPPSWLIGATVATAFALAVL